MQKPRAFSFPILFSVVMLLGQGCHRSASPASAPLPPMQNGTAAPPAVSASDLQRIMNDPAASPQAKTQAMARFQQSNK